MARKRPPRPEWLKQATAQADGHKADFEKNLKTIASALARQQHAEVVLIDHVDEALETLARCGLRKRAFWKRPEFQITVGSFLFGIAFSFPDVLPVFFPEAVLQREGITAGIVAATAVVGALIAIQGWYRSNWGK